MPLPPEILAAHEIEKAGFKVHNANLVFGVNCPNIDLIVYGKTSATYVQVKGSSRPATKDHVTIDGSPWDKEQLFSGAALYNKRGGHWASFILLVDFATGADPEFYVVPPDKLTSLVRPIAVAFARKPKKDGSPRSIAFRKQVPKKKLQRWRRKWELLGQPT
jgi:hypothetical protein